MVSTDSSFSKNVNNMRLFVNSREGCLYHWLRTVFHRTSLKSQVMENMKTILRWIYLQVIWFSRYQKKKKKTQVKGELDHITYIVLNWTYLLKPLQFQYKYWLEYGWVLPLLSVTLCILLGAKCFKLLSSVYFVILKAIFWKKIIEDRKREILWTFFALKKVKKIITRTWSPCYSWLKIKYLYDFWRWGVHCTV